LSCNIYGLNVNIRVLVFRAFSVGLKGRVRVTVCVKDRVMLGFRVTLIFRFMGFGFFCLKSMILCLMFYFLYFGMVVLG